MKKAILLLVVMAVVMLGAATASAECCNGPQIGDYRCNEGYLEQCQDVGCASNPNKPEWVDQDTECCTEADWIMGYGYCIENVSWACEEMDTDVYAYWPHDCDTDSPPTTCVEYEYQSWCGCGGGTYEGDVYLPNDAAVDAFIENGYTIVDGDVNIGYTDASYITKPNTDFLQCLEEVSGSIYFSYNLIYTPSVTMPRLKSAYRIRNLSNGVESITNCESLIDVTFIQVEGANLETLTCFKGLDYLLGLYVQGTGITDVTTNFEMLDWVESQLYIQNNADLPACDICTWVNGMSDEPSMDSIYNNYEDGGGCQSSTFPYYLVEACWGG
jgi:hypothetical protein